MMKFIFGRKAEEKDGTQVGAGTLYREGGFGFVTEENRREEERLRIPELNGGFQPACWMQGIQAQKLRADEYGVFSQIRREYPQEWQIPVVFKAAVPAEGNYRLTVRFTLPADAPESVSCCVFAGRRQLIFQGTLKPGETRCADTLVNVCPIIPRNHAEEMRELSVQTALVGNGVRLAGVTVRPEEARTIYIAGDSTVTDQIAEYPFLPEKSYSGWGQMLAYFSGAECAVSNHAHSGLTTESFRSEGHYDILYSRIRRGDICLFQFGHNDQKLAHLKAEEGYRENLERYIREIRSKGAYPVIVTPLARNTWKGDDGAYNDLLSGYAGVCRRIGEEQLVPVAALHERSMEFITENGREAARRYFYPSDYTHTNDFGAYRFARVIAEELKRLGVTRDCAQAEGWELPQEERSVQIPAGMQAAAPAEELFADLERPEEPLTRAEAFSMAEEAMRFFPTNVYNDMFTDVVGHETYAGAVECAWQNGLIPREMMKEGRLYPQREATGEEFVNILMQGYRSRKPLPENAAPMRGASDWAAALCGAAEALGCLYGGFAPKLPIARKDAARICRALKI